MPAIYVNSARGVFLQVLRPQIPVRQSVNVRAISSEAYLTKSITSRDDVKPFHHIPGPRGLPFIGSLLDYRIGRFRDLSKYHLALKDRHAHYGKIVRQRMPGISAVHLFDPEYVKVLYQHEGIRPDIPPLLPAIQLYRKTKKTSPGLGNTNGEEWYRLRSSVQRMMMRPQEVVTYLPSVVEVAENYVSRLPSLRDSNNEIPSLQNLTAKWSLESAGATCFGFRLGYLDGSQEDEVQKMIRSNLKIFQVSTKLRFSLPLFEVFNTPKWRQILKSEDYFLGNVLKYVERTASLIQEEVDGSEESDKYMFQKSMLASPKLMFEDVSILSLSMLADGLQTTVPNIFFNLYLLAKNPNVQEKVYNEVMSALPESGEITAGVLNKLTYLKACYKETFRFFPTGLDVSRITKEDIVIAGYNIPKGTRVEMNNFVLFQDPKYFPDPEVYRPERWLRDSNSDSVDPFVVLPFGRGPRMCVGRRFVEQETYVLLAKILQRFRLEWHHPDMEAKFMMLMMPDCPPRFSFIDRQST